MAGKHYVAIVNPVGGARRGRTLVGEIQQLLRDAGHTVATHITTHRGHAAQIAAATDLSGCAALCSVGGDGTLHQVASGLLQRTPADRPPLGIIPAGTGNSVLHHLGVCDPRQAVARILAGETTPLDVIRVVTPDSEPLYCVNLVGWGILADINQVAERWRPLGRSRYLLAALKHLFTAKPRPATLTIDGITTSDDFLFVAACNTRTIGSGMQMAPHAEIDDGKMDVVAVRRTSRLRMLQILRRVYSATHLELPEVEYAQASAIRLESQARDILNLDGENCGTTPLDAEVLPGALRTFA